MGELIVLRDGKLKKGNEKNNETSDSETSIGKSLARWNSLNNSMIEPLIETIKKLKGKDMLDKRDIRSLRKTLKNITYEGFLLLGVAPIALKECYELTERFITCRKKNN